MFLPYLTTPLCTNCCVAVDLDCISLLMPLPSCTSSKLMGSLTRGMIRKGWASVLKTHSSSGITDDGENSRYKYLRVSARKKLCILLSFSPVFTWDSSTRYTIRICSVSPNLRAWKTFDYEGKFLGHDTLPQCIKRTWKDHFSTTQKCFHHWILAWEVN